MKLKIYEALEAREGRRAPLLDCCSIAERFEGSGSTGRAVIIEARFGARAVIPDGCDVSPFVEQTRRLIADSVFGQLRTETLHAMQHIMARDHEKAFDQINRVLALMDGQELPEWTQ